MASAFSVKVDTGKIEALAQSLGQFTPEQLGALTVQAINEAAESAYMLSRKHMLRTINLTDAYVQEKMKLEPATTQSPTATITAFGGKKDMTGLSHYGAMQETQGVLHLRRSRGDTKRGIPAGEKADGMSVEVTRGSRKFVERGFTMPGKRDREGNLLLFTRDKAGKIKARTGPSVYQLVRAAATAIGEQVTDDLEATLIEMADKALQRATQ